MGSSSWERGGPKTSTPWRPRRPPAAAGYAPVVLGRLTSSGSTASSSPPRHLFHRPAQPAGGVVGEVCEPGVGHKVAGLDGGHPRAVGRRLPTVGDSSSRRRRQSTVAAGQIPTVSKTASTTRRTSFPRSGSTSAVNARSAPYKIVAARSHASSTSWASRPTGNSNRSDTRGRYPREGHSANPWRQARRAPTAGERSAARGRHASRHSTAKS